MKHPNLFKSLLLALIAAMLPQLASAYDFKHDGLCYNFNDDGISVTLTYEGTGQSGYGYANLSGTLNIPASVTYNGVTYAVTVIGSDAFYKSGLTSVTLPNSITVIEDYAFIFSSSLTTITIPNSVTTIGYAAFSNCTGLTSVTIPNSVTTIGNQAFNNCTGLTSVTISNSVTSIPVGCFVSCTSLHEVTIGNSVTSIGMRAFENCTALTSVTIPISVTKIGQSAFRSCTGLTSVIVPNSVTSIYANSFLYCSGLNSIMVDNGNPIYDSRNNCNAIIEKATNTLILGCKNTTIPNSVTSIGDYAFYGCTGLTSITIPYSVTSIDWRAFYGCTGLTSVTIPNSVTSIGEDVFNECNSLTSVVIPNSVTWIGSGAFNNCTNLISLTLTGQGAWNPKSNMPYTNQLKTLNIGSRINSLGNFSFAPEVVNCYAETPPTCSYNTFSSYDGELHVPTASVAAYFTAEYWQNFSNLINDLEKVTLNQANASLVQWETLTLSATVTPQGDEVIWSSTNPDIASVDENGVVTATGGGECDIYATLASSHDAAYAVCHITVDYPEIILSLSEESLELNLGDEYELTATIVPENTGLTPTWTSSDENVATVVDGKVIAVGEGECDIIATLLDKTATCHVTVTNNVTITLNIDNALIGASQMLTVYPDCTPDVPVELVVTTSDPSIALARVVNRTNAPALGVTSFPEKDMALNLLEELGAPSESKDPALASTKAVMIVGVQNGTATITVTTADGQATPAVLNLRVVDVDGDRTITASDITCLYNFLLNGDDTYIATSDTDGDGFITSSDITEIYYLLLGN